MEPIAIEPDATEAGSSSATQPRRARRRTLLLVGAAFAAGSVISGTTAAIAVSNFTDVPANHQFKSQIDWMVDQGISQGYDDGSFKPTAPVSRQAFASFLNKYNARIQMRDSTASKPQGTSWTHETPCAPGQRAVGGSGETTLVGIAMTDGYASDEGHSWSVRFESFSGTKTPTITVTAICVPEV